MSGHRFTTAAEALAFLLAGNATLTLVSGKTGREGGASHFVSLLTGSDNEADYTSIGMLREGRRYVHGTKVSRDAPGAVAWAWAWGHLVRGELPASLEVWHEGRCGRCGRLLTVPASIASGLGPECAGKLGMAA
jgi:hypothetical protein